jgi:hypothetical protein
VRNGFAVLEIERQERFQMRRYRQISQDVQLEEDMKLINREPNFLNEKDASTDEEGSEDEVSWNSLGQQIYRA